MSGRPIGIRVRFCGGRPFVTAHPGFLQTQYAPPATGLQWGAGVYNTGMTARSAIILETNMDYRDRITIEAGKRSGKPCIRGMRITVYDVLDYMASGMSHAEILSDFPELTEEDLRACLAFAADRERRLSACII